MDKKGNCSQCNKEFSRKHLSPIINDLVRHKTAFRKVFEKNENPKFCKACKNKWLDLGKIKSDKVKEFIENMTSLNKKETSIDDNEKNDTGNQNDKKLHGIKQNVSDTDLAVSGPSGMQNNASEVTSAINDHLQAGENLDQDSFLHAQKERDHWYQLWINGFCSSETGDEYLSKMEEYAKKWKESEKKMKEINPKYEPLV